MCQRVGKVLVWQLVTFKHLVWSSPSVEFYHRGKHSISLARVFPFAAQARVHRDVDTLWE